MDARTAGVEAGPIQEIHETVQRGVVGILFPSHCPRPRCHRVCPGGQRGSRKCTHARALHFIGRCHPSSDGLHCDPHQRPIAARRPLRVLSDGTSATVIAINLKN